MTQDDKTMLRDIHTKVHETAINVAVLTSRYDEHVSQSAETKSDLAVVKKKINYVEGVVWTVAIVFAGIGLLMRYYSS